MASFVRTARKVVAIGRNYADHAKELGNAVPTGTSTVRPAPLTPQEAKPGSGLTVDEISCGEHFRSYASLTPEPFFFLKPPSSFIQPGEGPVEIPKGVHCHHEVELGVVIGKPGRDIPKADAESYIAGYTLAIDLTGRNVQDAVKKKGLPWSAAKGYDTFMPVGPFIPKSKIADTANVGLHFAVNGTTRQKGVSSDMIFPVPDLIAFVSSIMKLEEGDLILTGTPKGVSRMVAGDKFEAKMTYPGVDGDVLDQYEFDVVDRKGSAYEFKG